MKTPLRLLMLLAVAFVSFPAAGQAQDSTPPVTFDRVRIIPSQSTLSTLSLRLCNSAGEPVSIQLEAHNTAIHTFYRRNFLVRDEGCSEQSMDLPRGFSAMAQFGDPVKVSLKGAQGSESRALLPVPKPVQAFFGAAVQTPATPASADLPKTAASSKAAKPCLSTVQEGVHSLCLGALATHTSGLRIKFGEWKNDQATLKIRRFRWGGEQDLRLQVGESKTIYSWDKPYRRLKMTLEKGLEKDQIQLRLERLY